MSDLIPDKYKGWIKDHKEPHIGMLDGAKVRIRKCGTCKHFLGGGDFGTCCDQMYELKYRDSKACEKYSEMKEE